MTGKDAASFVSLLAAGLLGLCLSGCATGISLDSEPSRRSSASVADFTFDSTPPFAAPAELSRWKALAAATAEHETAGGLVEKIHAMPLPGAALSPGG